MAERSRSIFDRLTGRNRGVDAADIERLGELMNRSVASADDFSWDGKTLASLSRLQMGTTSAGYGGTKTVSTEVDYALLLQIARKCEVVNAILRRTSDDVLANGYMFKLKDDLERGDPEQLKRARQFMAQPNSDNMGDELMEGLIHDLTLFGDCYIELSGSDDRKVGKTGWDFGGDLLGIWRIDADTVRLLPGTKTPEPPRMAFEQTYKGNERQFTATKVLHITKHKQGRAYGQSPLISLMGVIAGYLNLQNYIGDLFTGTIPKTILNVGDISNAEMKAMLALIEQQLVGGQSPYGLVTINGGTGFALHKLIDSAKEGQFLDLLYYYREEICAVFGIPPMKLGFVQTGKLANPEQQLDVWYDVVDLMQRRIAQLFNTRIMPLLGITDWEFAFNSIRPKRDAERAQIIKEQAGAISNLRQESVISINEARSLLNLEALEVPEARDPFFLSPKLSINMGASNAGGDPSDTPTPEGEGETGEEPEADVEALFNPPTKRGRRRDLGEFVYVENDRLELDDDTRDIIFDNLRKNVARGPLDELEDERFPILENDLTLEQSAFAEDLLDSLDEVFSNTKSITKATAGEVRQALVIVDEKIALAEAAMAEEMTATLTATYAETLAATGAAIGTDIAFTGADTAALAFWDDVWRLPALENTLGSYRGLISSVFSQMLENNWSWDKAAREMRSVIDPAGKNYPRYYYERIARTETRRVVENAHLSALVKVGFDKVERLVTVDPVTDVDLCLPFENAIYSAEEAYGVLPAHPNCRCSMTAYTGDKPAIPDDEVLVPEFKAVQGSLSAGDFVSWTTEKGTYAGKVRRIVTTGRLAVVAPSGGNETIEVSDDDQVAIVQVYINNEDNTYTPSDRDAPVRVAMLRKRGEPETKAKAVSAKVREALAAKADEHNEDVGDVASKRTNTRTLAAVFERGVGAYQQNPGSVRPTVTSAEQWAYARVNSFLYALRNGRFRGGKHDQDLLPKGHPQSTKGKSYISKRALTTKDRTPPQGVRKACQVGLRLHEEGYSGDGLEPATVREARSIARGQPITVAKARKMIRWWGRNSRFLDEPKDSPAWTSAQLWGGRPGRSWASKLQRALEAEE